MATERGRRVTKWKRSRLLAGGAIVLVGAVWTGPQMAAAAPKEKPAKEKGGTTTTAAPSSSATSADKPGNTESSNTGNGPGSGGGQGQTKDKGNDGSTTTTTPPGGGGATPPPSSGGGAGGGDGGGKASPPAGSTTQAPPSVGLPGGGSAPSISPTPAPTSPSASTSPSAPTAPGRRFIGPRSLPSVDLPTPSVAVPPAAADDNALAALQRTDRAAQATVRSINGGQSLPTQGGTALYAQLASTPGPLSSDSYPGNPYLVFVILTVFGIGIGVTGRRREDALLVA